MVQTFCMEFQREPLKSHTKYLNHTLKGVILIQYWKFKSFQIYAPISVFEMPPNLPFELSCWAQKQIVRKEELTTTVILKWNHFNEIYITVCTWSCQKVYWCFVLWMHQLDGFTIWRISNVELWQWSYHKSEQTLKYIGWPNNGLKL